MYCREEGLEFLKYCGELLLFHSTNLDSTKANCPEVMRLRNTRRTSVVLIPEERIYN